MIDVGTQVQHGSMCLAVLEEKWRYICFEERDKDFCFDGSRSRKGNTTSHKTSTVKRRLHGRMGVMDGIRAEEHFGF